MALGRLLESINRALEQKIWSRARYRCEYCHFAAEHARGPLQIDHVIAEKHRGKTTAENLALSCYYCNLYKGANVAGIDPQSGRVIRLFHPRKDSWSKHFAWQGTVLRGLTAAGSTTIEVLEINRPIAVQTRQLIDGGSFPS